MVSHKQFRFSKLNPPLHRHGGSCGSFRTLFVDLDECLVTDLCDEQTSRVTCCRPVKARCTAPAGRSDGNWSVFVISVAVEPRAPAQVIASAADRLYGEKNRLPVVSRISRKMLNANVELPSTRASSTFSSALAKITKDTNSRAPTQESM